MSILRWRKIRKAEIPKERQDLFQRFGEFVIASVLSGAFQHSPGELKIIFTSAEVRTQVIDWLTECADKRKRREDRVEFIEVAILVVFLVSIALEIVSIVIGLKQLARG